MKRRIRKKKRVGEFKELGFTVRMGLRANISEEDLYALHDRMVDWVEARRLCFGGDDCELFVSHFGRGSATEQDRDGLAVFFAAEGDVERHKIGALRDAWYGWDRALCSDAYVAFGSQRSSEIVRCLSMLF